MLATRIMKLTSLIASSLLVASGPAYACNDPGTCPCQNLQQAVVAMTNIEVQEANGHISVVDVELLGDREFLREALEEGAVQVLLGQLAQQKSQSADITQFSQTMVKDNTDLSEQVIQRAAKLLAMEGQATLSKKDKQLAASLEGLSGPAFDEVFLKVMVRDHERLLKRFTSEITLTQDPGVKIAAELGTNEVAQRLKLLEQIAERHSAVALNQNLLAPKN